MAVSPGLRVVARPPVTALSSGSTTSAGTGRCSWWRRRRGRRPTRGGSASTGLVRNPTTWTWRRFKGAPLTYNGDIDCVTTWSKPRTTWTDVHRHAARDRRRLPVATHVHGHVALGLHDGPAAWDVYGGHAVGRREIDVGRLLASTAARPPSRPYLYFWKSVGGSPADAARRRLAGLLGSATGITIVAIRMEQRNRATDRVEARR